MNIFVLVQRDKLFMRLVRERQLASAAIRIVVLVIALYGILLSAKAAFY